METLIATTLFLTSPAFSHNDLIPSMYTCDGENINPPITIGNIPEDTKSLVLMVEDVDSYNSVYNHWMVWNIPAVKIIEENSIPGIEGINSFQKISYGGPCPPKGTVHRYFFRVFALDTLLNFQCGTEKEIIVNAMEDHILAQGELMGRYGH